MATINTDLTDVVTAYLDNADFEETADTAEAALFITACRRYLVMQPTEADKGDDGPSIKFDPKVVAEELERARQWVACQDENEDGVIHPNFTNCERY